MAGSPWHPEQVHRGDGDARRYKGRCRFYSYDHNHCSRRCSKCIGSAHCMEYIAISDEEFRKRQKARQNGKGKNAGKGDDDVYWY